MRKGNRWIALTACVVSVALASGCSAQVVQETPAAKEVNGFAPALPTDTEGALTVAAHYSNFESLEAEFARFNEIYPNIELSYVSLDSYNQTIIPAIASAEAPDIFYLALWMTDKEEYDPLFEAAEDLSDEALGIDLGCIRPGLIYREESGAVPMAPIFSSTMGMLINADLFQKEGLAVPKSYNELINVCDAFKEKGYKTPILVYNDESHQLNSYPCEVTVPVPATKKTVYYVKAGKTASIALKDTKLKVKQFVWTSGDPAVATAGEHTGKVTGVAGGMTTIYGTYTDEATGGKVVVYCGVEVSGPIATSGDVNQYEQYWGNFNIKAVSNGPKQSTVFTVGSDGLFLQAIRTYHYNKGNGATPGTITIKKGSKTIGVYQANGNTGNSFRDVFPNIYLDAGTYTIIDSGKSTWSYNADSGNAGFAIVYGTTP